MKEIIKNVFIWRVLVTLAAIPALFLFPVKPGFTYLSTKLSLIDLALMWQNFDGIHYLNLAKYGYGGIYTGFLYAFFPVFPLLIRFFSSIFQDYLASGLIIAHLSLILSLWFLFKLVKLDYQEKIARSTLLLLLIFPTSFFFGSVYSESLFLLLSVASFYFARKNNFLLASILVGLASATRITGILLLPSILIEYYIYHHKSLKLSLTPQLFYFLLAPLGLFFYMRFLNQSVQDPFYFIHVQPLFGTVREINHLVLLYQVFYRYAKMLIFINHADPLFFTVLLEFLSGFIFLILSLFTFRFTRTSYALYALLAYLLPTLTGTFSSLPRYVLVLFPCFIVLARFYSQSRPVTQKIYLLVCLIMSVISISLFTRGYFVG